MCPEACCGMPVSECTCGPDCEHCDCYEKNKATSEGIAGMMPNTQVRGIMPKQRKPYHKHKIKSDYEPETDLSEDEDEYDDDWYCKDCGHGPIGIEADDCPECGSTWSSQNEGVEVHEEDDEYDPRRVKADVVKHLVNMFNDAKKDGGYSSEKMHFALGNLLHDMDMAGYMNSDYFDIEGFFHKGIAKKQDYKVNMDMLRRAYKQAKNLDTDTSVDPAVFKRGGSAMKSVATESEEKNYVCVHAKKGKHECKATSSYGAAKKAAEHWGLKSTAGIDAHLSDEKKTATESMLRNVTKELTEAEFDEAAGEKDACYRKVKSRYKVWPSAYASGALVKCRKVGAANWGNKSKK